MKNAAVCADPQAALAGGSNPDGDVGTSHSEGSLEIRAVEKLELSGGCQPDFSIPIRRNGATRARRYRHAVGAIEARDVAILETADGAAAVRDPERVLSIFNKLPGNHVGQPVGEGAHCAGFELKEGGVVGGEPEAALATAEDDVDLAIGDGAEAGAGDQFEGGAVEPGEVAVIGEPDEAIGSLGEGGDVVVGQAVIGPPGADDPGGFGGGEAGNGRGKEPEQARA